MIEARLNPDWYRVKYNLAALHANWAATFDPGEKTECVEAVEHRGRAHTHAQELIEAALEQLVERENETDPALLSLLEKSILPTALILYGGTGPRMTTQGTPHREFHLHDPPRDLHELLTTVRSGLDERGALRYAASMQQPIPPRTLYNLACAYAQDEEFEEAKACLEKALRTAPERERKQLAARAKVDPSLRPLREAEVYEHVETGSVAKVTRDFREFLKKAMASRLEQERAEAAEEASEAVEADEEEGPTATA
ncbi:MAG: tetratricopeptide repeat protein [Solirubrobacterales bacterium]